MIIISSIWSPMVCTGESELIGSWKIIAIWLPRMARSGRLSGLSRAISVDAWPSGSNCIDPRRISAFLSSNRSTARAVTDLPQPLSPTSASVLPGVSVRSTCRTASISASSGEEKLTDMSLMVRMGFSAIALPPMWIGRIAQPIAKEVHRQDHDHHAEPRRQQPGCCGQRADILRVLQQRAPADDGCLQPEPEEGERRFRQDHAGNGQRRRSDNVAHEAGHHMPGDDAPVAGAVELRRRHEILGTK